MPGNDVEIGEKTPLLNQSGAGGYLKDMKAASFKERFVAVIASVSFITSVLGIIFEAALHPSVYVSGVMGCLLSPFAVLQQKKLTQVEVLEQTNEAMEREVVELSQENNLLMASVQQLEESVSQLQSMEETLATLQSVQGISITELESQVEESRNILSGMKRNVRGEVLQNLISVLLTVDTTDQDMILSDAEIDSLIANLDGISGSGVQLREAVFKDCIIEHGRSLVALMEVTRNLMQDDLPDEKCIFKFLEKRPAS